MRLTSGFRIKVSTREACYISSCFLSTQFLSDPFHSRKKRVRCQNCINIFEMKYYFHPKSYLNISRFSMLVSPQRETKELIHLFFLLLCVRTIKNWKIFPTSRYFFQIAEVSISYCIENNFSFQKWKHWWKKII